MWFLESDVHDTIVYGNVLKQLGLVKFRVTTEDALCEPTQVRYNYVTDAGANGLAETSEGCGGIEVLDGVTLEELYDGVTDHDLYQPNTLKVNIIPDKDGDLIETPEDNCIYTVNVNQRDTDSDGYGNRCDCDWNNDPGTLCDGRLVGMNSFY
jgi:hypothetical protein